jgi:hypothetical protein
MFLGSSSVALTLQVPRGNETTTHTCVVTTPSGQQLAKSVQAPAALLGGIAPVGYTVWYPDQFVGSSPLEPGRYLVEWRRGAIGDEPPAAGDQARILAGKMMLVAMPLVARDSFAIPEPRREATS